MIQNYDEFITELHRAGFSLGGGSSKGIYAAVPFDWTEQPAGTQVRWHTGEPDTDPGSGACASLRNAATSPTRRCFSVEAAT